MVEKVKNFFSSKAGKITTASLVGTNVLAVATAFAEGEGATSTIPDLSTITSALTSSLTVESLVSMIASVIGFAMPYVLMWFGYRFLKRAFTKAVMAGRL